jgi:hypothetical protein
MRAWVRLARIDLSGYEFTTPMCRDCNRFYKNALKDHSPLFVRLNGLINPVFDFIIERIVGPEVVQDSKRRALGRDQVEPPEELDRWTQI